MDHRRLLRKLWCTISATAVVVAPILPRASAAQAPALVFSHVASDAATRPTSAIAAAVSLPVDARRQVTLTAIGEVRPAFAPLQVDGYLAGAALSLPLGESRAFVVYRTAASPLRVSSPAAGALDATSDSTHPAATAFTMSRAPISELSVGVGKRIGSISFELSTGAAQGIVREDATTPGRIVMDSIWSDTLGWVEHRREISGSRVTSAVGAHWLSSELAASWTRSRFAAGATVGGQFAGSRTTPVGFGSLELSARLLPNVWLVGTAGVGPDLARSGGVPTRFSMLGLRFAYATRDAAGRGGAPPSSSLTIAAIDSVTYLFSLRIPDAQRVELSSEFTHWQPVSMVRAADGLWAVPLRVAPGAYRMNVRIDGGSWQAPPGTTPIADDFGGSAGVVVVSTR